VDAYITWYLGIALYEFHPTTKKKKLSLGNKRKSGNEDNVD